jgi:hypothetical protein
MEMTPPTYFYVYIVELYMAIHALLTICYCCKMSLIFLYVLLI